jgi:hypothetical protein
MLDRQASEFVMFSHSHACKITCGLVWMLLQRAPHNMHTVQPQSADSGGDSACEEQPSSRVLTTCFC